MAAESTRTRQAALPWIALAVIGVLFAGYALAFIWRTSYVLPRSETLARPTRFFALMDDQMISMRYARHLADGDGLVWNPGGERVEGFTNPLWVGLMALVHLVESDSARTSLWIQLVGMGFLLATLAAVWRLMGALDGSRWLAVGAVGSTAFFFPLNVWSLQGNEVSVLALITTLAAWWSIRLMQRERFGVGPYLLLGVGTWVRLDMAVVYAALSACWLVADPRHRRAHLLASAAVLAFFVGTQTVLRYAYYGEVLPNTYYLKMTGYPILRRLRFGTWVLADYGFVFGVPALLAGGALLARPDRRREVSLLIGVILALAGYTWYIGGDTWEQYGIANRFVSQAAPLLFALLWITLGALYHAALEPAPGHRQPRLAAGGVLLLAAACFAALNFNHSYGARATIRQMLLLDRPILTAQNVDRTAMALYLDHVTRPDATVAVIVAGTVPYFSERQYIDLLGKCDARIARGPVNPRFRGPFLPGHMKWDFAYSIGQLQPDVVLDTWSMEPDVRPYLQGDYRGVLFPGAHAVSLLRTDSPDVRWERIE